jgi:DNA-binding NtrC family response regulator
MAERIGPKRALLVGLDEGVARELAGALHANSWETSAAQQAGPEQAELVFCGPGLQALEAAVSAFPGTPVVVASRLPDEHAWLDALESGAADYCAAPFETEQIRWLLAGVSSKARAMAA